jgi:hypothetical protein
MTAWNLAAVKDNNCIFSTAINKIVQIELNNTSVHYVLTVSMENINIRFPRLQDIATNGKRSGNAS